MRFLTIDSEPCPPEDAKRFSFDCVVWNRGKDPRLPKVSCGDLLIAARTGIKRDGQNRNGGRAQWDFDGNAAAPTFSPSINCEGYCGWHGYIRKGRCVDTSGKDEP